MELKIDIKNFRSIKSTQLSIKSGVNILIGPNGSGKTSIFLALKFLRDVIFRGAGLAVAKGGGARRTYRRGETEISFLVKYALGERIYHRRKTSFEVTWEIKISKKGNEETATIIGENLLICALREGQAINVFEVEVRRNLTSPKYKLYVADVNDIGKDLFSIMLTDSPYLNKTQALEHLKKNLNEILKQAKKNEDKSFFPQLAWLDEELRNLYLAFLNLNEYNILPDTARQSTDQLPFAEMLPNGRNLSEVIYALEKKNFHRITESRMYDEEYPYPYRYPRSRIGYFYPRPFYMGVSMKSRELGLRESLDNINTELAAAVKPIEAVSAEIDQTNGKRFVVFKAGKHTFYPEEVSDGTIKWLCILVSLYVPFSKIYLLEEPENFLHPWMQQRLINIMREQAATNKSIFLLTTHSATILNVAMPEEVIMVKSTDTGTIASFILDKDEIEVSLAESNFGLGDLWVSGAIGGVPGENE